MVQKYFIHPQDSLQIVGETLVEFLGRGRIYTLEIWSIDRLGGETTLQHKSGPTKLVLTVDPNQSGYSTLLMPDCLYFAGYAIQADGINVGLGNYFTMQLYEKPGRVYSYEVDEEAGTFTLITTQNGEVENKAVFTRS